MVDITDPTIVRFVQAFVRPLSGSMIGNWASATVESKIYSSTVSALLAPYDNADVIVDASGPVPLTKGDITTFMSKVDNYLDWLAGVAVAADSTAFARLNKPHTVINLP